MSNRHNTVPLNTMKREPFKIDKIIKKRVISLTQPRIGLNYILLSEF